MNRPNKTYLLILGSQGKPVGSGTFVNRQSEIVGVTSYVQGSPIAFSNPYELMIIFQEDRNDSKSHTFITYSQSQHSVDARSDIVQRMAFTLMPFIQDKMFATLPGFVSREVINYTHPIVRHKQHYYETQSIITDFLNKHIDTEHPVAKLLQRVEIRSNPAISALILRFMLPDSK
jgi:hypothetical protein